MGISNPFHHKEKRQLEETIAEATGIAVHDFLANYMGYIKQHVSNQEWERFKNITADFLHEYLEEMDI